MSKISPHEEKMVNLQHQMRQNQQDLQDFLSDLGNWEDEMKTKEKELTKKKSGQTEDLPPVRNSLDKKKLKKKKKKPVQERKPKKINGFDFRAWDKFDVDKALEEIDEEDKKSSSEYETDEEWENERKKHLANEEKNTGNTHLSAGALEVAVECYSRGVELDPTNAILPANRALALVKMERYGAAEVDCTTAITLDPLYVKAYLRRAAARVGLQNLEGAVEDYGRVLQLEPSNKQAQAETERIQKELKRKTEESIPEATSLEKSDTSEVNTVYKPPEQRSKKPLRRIQIEEIGIKEDTERKAAIKKVEAQQSKVKKETEAKDRLSFEKFTSDTLTNGRVEKQNSLSDNAPPPTKKAGITEISSGEETHPRADKGVKSGAAKTGMQNGVSSSSKPGKKQDSTPKPTSPRGGGGSSSPRERDAPQTSFQFQSDFKALKDDLPAFHAYFKKIGPAMYPKLFGQSLEAPVLLKILDGFREFGIKADEDCYEHLLSLSDVKRFSMITMFFSSKEKQGIREIFEHLRKKGLHTESELDKLKKKYEL